MLDTLQFQDLSTPGCFWLASTLENKAAAFALARSPALSAQLESIPQGIFTIVGETTGWQSVAAGVGRPTRPGYGFTSMITIKSGSGVQQGFEQTMREVIAQFERHGRGLQSIALSRLAGGTTQYVFYLHFDRSADCVATLNDPAIAQLGKDDPAGPYLAAPYEIVLSDVVRVAVGQAAAVAR